MARDLAARRAKVERRYFGHAIFQHEMSRHPLERQLRRIDALGRELHVRIHDSQFFKLIRLVGEKAWARFEFARLPSLRFRSRFAGGRRRRRVEQAGKIVQIELFRYDVRAHQRALAADIERDVAGHVAVSDAPFEVAITQHVRLAAEAPLQLIRRRVRQRHPKERPEIAKVVAGHVQLQVDALQLQRRG